MDGLVVVTGANGHIGNNLCRQLLEEGYTVRGTVRSLDKAPDLDMEFVEADVLEKQDVGIMFSKVQLDCFICNYLRHKRRWTTNS